MAKTKAPKASIPCAGAEEHTQDLKRCSLIFAFPLGYGEEEGCVFCSPFLGGQYCAELCHPTAGSVLLAGLEREHKKKKPKIESNIDATSKAW